MAFLLTLEVIIRLKSDSSDAYIVGQEDVAFAPRRGNANLARKLDNHVPIHPEIELSLRRVKTNTVPHLLHPRMARHTQDINTQVIERAQGRMVTIFAWQASLSV